MRTATLMSVAILLLVVAPVSAANIYFEHPAYTLPQNVTDYQVNVMASGGEATYGIDLFLQVQTNGPEIVVSELSKADGGLIGPGLIFQGNEFGAVVEQWPGDPNRVLIARSFTGLPDPPANPLGDRRLADGKLAILTFSTVGISPGAYQLSLSGTVEGQFFASSFFDGNLYQPIVTNLESTMLNVVPEPSVIVQILGLLGAVPAVLVYRRWKAAR